MATLNLGPAAWKWTPHGLPESAAMNPSTVWFTIVLKRGTEQFAAASALKASSNKTARPDTLIIVVLPGEMGNIPARGTFATCRESRGNYGETVTATRTLRTVDAPSAVRPLRS